MSFPESSRPRSRPPTPRILCAAIFKDSPPQPNTAVLFSYTCTVQTQLARMLASSAPTTFPAHVPRAAENPLHQIHQAALAIPTSHRPPESGPALASPRPKRVARRGQWRPDKRPGTSAANRRRRHPRAHFHTGRTAYRAMVD